MSFNHRCLIRALVSLIVLLLVLEGYIHNPCQAVDGPCTYDSFAGSCKITSVAKTEESIEQKDHLGGPGYEGYEVKFNYKPDPSLSEDEIREVQDYVGPEYLLLLTNSWYPGPKFLKKYGIEEGVVFDCQLKRILSGACTPLLFEFPDIDQSDYFESGLPCWDESGIFPNPVTSSTATLYVEAEFDTVTLNIFDLSGIKVLEKTYSQNDAMVDLSHLDNGVYLYVLMVQKRCTFKSPVKKLLVQR